MIGCPVQFLREVFRDCMFVVVVDTHLPRFEALAYVLPHFDALTRGDSCVLGVHLSVKASKSVRLLKGLLNLRKAYIDLCLLNHKSVHLSAVCC